MGRSRARRRDLVLMKFLSRRLGFFSKVWSRLNFQVKKAAFKWRAVSYPAFSFRLVFLKARLTSRILRTGTLDRPFAGGSFACAKLLLKRTTSDRHILSEPDCVIKSKPFFG